MAGRGFYPEMSEGMIAYVASQIRTFFGRCVSAPSDRSLPVLVAMALSSAFGPPPVSTI
jgi:hypothetical protein